MDKRKVWRWTMGLAVAAACTLASFAWPKTPDGMEFLREFRHKEYKTQNPFCDLKPNTPQYDPSRPWYRVFRFPNMDDVQVRSELKKHSPNPNVRGDLFVVLPNGRRGNYFDGVRMLALYDEPAPNWLSLQLLTLKRRLNR